MLLLSYGSNVQTLSCLIKCVFCYFPSEDFILRWGTHYIKSARFGGQLELRKTQLASETSSKATFAEESEAEYKSLFWSAGSRSSTKSGESSKSQQKYMSTSIVVQGGSQKIATVISDMYSPTFKTAFTVSNIKLIQRRSQR